MPKSDARKSRREDSVRRRQVGAPLFVIAGVHQQYAERVESLAANRLRETGTRGAVWVPQVNYRVWYSEDEGSELFRLIATRVIGQVATQLGHPQDPGEPTPKAVFILYLNEHRGTWHANVMRYFKFWAWPYAFDMVTADESPQDPEHRSRTPGLVADRIAAAIKHVLARDSRWTTIQEDLRNAHSPYRLPPINFRYPTEGEELGTTYAQILYGHDAPLPRTVRARQGSLSSRVVGYAHHCDACGRYFPRGRGEDGCLREPPPTADTDRQLLWLNAAFRFGTWLGDDHEHYDVQRTIGGNVSPPPIYCAERKLSTFAQKAYVNMFHNDVLRDNDIFPTPDPTVRAKKQKSRA